MIIGKSPVNNSWEAADLQELVDKGHLTPQVQVSPQFLRLLRHLKIQPVINGAFSQLSVEVKK